MTTLPEANAKFALDFFRRLSSEHPSDNLLFSPLNLSAACGLLLQGSAGNTAAELEKVLHWDELKEREKVRNTRYLTTRLRTSASPAKFQEKDKIYSRPYPEQRTKPHDDRRTAPEPQHTKPRVDRRQTPQQPSPGSEPEAPACPQTCVLEYECENPEGVHTAFSNILAELNKPSTNYFLSFAKKLFGDQAIAFNQEFLFCALKLYLTEVGRADFHMAPEEVRRLINLWVEVRSHGEIKDIIPENSLDCLTQLLMVNTTYFKGLWEIQFNKELTEEAPFYTHEKTSHTVQLMHTRGTYNTGLIHLSNVDVQVLEMPYKNHEMSLFILLPKDRSAESLLQLEDALSHVELLDWSHYLEPEDVEVAIPKFRMEKTAEADKYLNVSQINDAEKADFSGAMAVHGVALSQLVHDTLFEVDEEGGKEPATKKAQYQHFVADHPFLFYVLHKFTHSIIIFGRFSKPE
uniref:leukocyte elastase inhibitor-like n=1 Tax=Euleptes europaea TaxID=460621 RepID=UPI0025416E5D|nr:leukocyte elastase inhibitor-like [Euleptes europaea]